MRKLDVNKSRTTVSVTDGREALAKFWIAIYVQINTEKKVHNYINKLGIESYVPIQQEFHQWSDRKKLIDRIVIPSIVFVNVDKSSLQTIRMIPNVKRLISYPGDTKPAIIPDYQIINLQFLLKNSDLKVFISNDDLKIGQSVKIIRGPLSGLVGNLCSLSDGKDSIGIRVDVLGYACVNVSKTDIIINQ